VWTYVHSPMEPVYNIVLEDDEPIQRRRIVMDRRSMLTTVTADVIVHGGKKYFHITHLNLFFEYIDNDTIGEQVETPSTFAGLCPAKAIRSPFANANGEPSETWVPLKDEITDVSGMNRVFAPSIDLWSAEGIVRHKTIPSHRMTNACYCVSSDRRFYTLEGYELTEPYWRVPHPTMNETLRRVCIRDVVITPTNKQTMRLVPGYILESFEEYKGRVEYHASYTASLRIQGLRLPLPINLTDFLCYNMKLTELPVLPATLKVLNCSHNKLTCLPPLPPNLESLICSSNLLSCLPPLPSTLRILSCASNKLLKFPAKLPELYRLNCRNTGLTMLPDLPASLGFLDCSQNRLGTLPSVLPPTLDTLWCTNCCLKDLPEFPASLTRLDYSHNRIRGAVCIPKGLCYYKCTYNPVTELYIDSHIPYFHRTPAAPHGCHPMNHTNRYGHMLKKLLCSHTRITCLPSELPYRLDVLDCSYTPLETLATLPDGLLNLNCSHTRLRALPDFPRSLITLKCHHTPLSRLPAPFPEQLTYIHCSHTNIRTLPTIILRPFRMVEYLNCAHTRVPQDLLRYIERHDLESVNYYTYAQEHKEARKADIRDVVSLLMALGKDHGGCLTTVGGLELPADVVQVIAGYLTKVREIVRSPSLIQGVITIRKEIEEPIVLPETIL